VNPRCVIVGLGSPHGWDRLGWQVLDLLAEEGIDAELIKCNASGLDWIERASPADRLTFIDALINPGTPGEIQRYELTAENLISGGTTLSSHGFGFKYSVELSHALRQLPPTFFLYGALAALEPPTDAELENAAREIAKRVANETRRTPADQ